MARKLKHTLACANFVQSFLSHVKSQKDFLLCMTEVTAAAWWMDDSGGLSSSRPSDSVSFCLSSLYRMLSMHVASWGCIGACFTLQQRLSALIVIFSGISVIFLLTWFCCDLLLLCRWSSNPSGYVTATTGGRNTQQRLLVTLTVCVNGPTVHTQVIHYNLFTF